MLQIRASADVIFHLLYPLNWYACIQHSISPCVLSHVLMAQDTHLRFSKESTNKHRRGTAVTWRLTACSETTTSKLSIKTHVSGTETYPAQEIPWLFVISFAVFLGFFLHLFIAFNNVFCSSSCCFLFGCLLFVKHCHKPIDHRSISMIFHGIFNNKSGLLDCNFFSLQYLIQNHLFKSMKLSWQLS